ncbi:IclR family transcriptional regulator [Neorhizobium sp. NCHU2750]|uniref:IclR family transcriptional regulator n=1 Tax=Neorhizobium sp. NCHU2750 TaxID=1825976 RepID=UPI000E76B345|nr:IclR family transcriptional regulator [Neorhizobium sp. NCHU2750]
MTIDKTTATTEKAAVQGTAAFSKFMTILQIVSDSDEPLTTAAIAKLANLPRPTAYRIIAALLSEGMLVENTSGRLGLGPRLISLAARSFERSDIRTTARGPLETLRDTVNETIHLAVNSGDEMVYIDKLESNRPVSMRSRIGTRVPLYSSSVGKAWLSTLPETEATKIIATLSFEAKTEHTVSGVTALSTQLVDVRRRGYSLDLEENEAEICCYGVPIVAGEGEAIACISCSIPRYRFETLPADSIVSHMKACAAEIAMQVRRT